MAWHVAFTDCLCDEKDLREFIISWAILRFMVEIDLY